MTIDDVIGAWNKQADEYNQWESLDADERVNFALQYTEKEITEYFSTELAKHAKTLHVYNNMPWFKKNFHTNSNCKMQIYRWI